MKFDDDFDYDTDDREIYSSSGRPSSRTYEDLSSVSPEYRRVRQAPVQKSASHTTKKPVKKRKKHTVRNFLIIMLCCLLVFCGGFYAYSYSVINKIDRQPLDQNDLGISTSDYGTVKNIALLGIDSRKDDNVGRSDAIVVLTIDKKHKSIKLSSIARDTYVSIDGHSKDKLTHAYAYGKSQLAVKTLNQNFGLEITDYITVNFFELARVIDYIGGVTVDVDEKEMNEMNTNIIPWLVVMGIPCEKITHTGTQLLSGGQAVCYARIRHTDSDIERGNRQKEVLSSMFATAKKMNPLKLPNFASMVIEECQTSLSTNDIMMLGAWALAFSPEIKQLSIPNENVPSSGKIINRVWYYVYDLEAAKKEIHDFIFEENFYTPEAVAARTASSASK